MLLVSYICLLAVCIISGIFYSILNYKLKAINVAIKLFAPLSCVLLALVTANLTSAISGYSLFLMIGLLLIVCAEGLNFVEDKNNTYYFVKNIISSCGYICFALSGIILGNFNVFAILFSLFFSAGVVLILFAIQGKQKPFGYYLSNLILFITLGLMLGYGFVQILNTLHLLATILYISGAACITIGTLFHLFRNPENAISKIMGNAIYIIGLIAFASSIYMM